MRSRHVLLQGAFHTRLPGVDALVLQRQRTNELDDMFDGHTVAQHTADELGVVPVLRVELLRQALDGNLIAATVLKLKVVALRAVGVHLLDDLALRDRLRQEDTLLVVLQTSEYLVGIAVKQSDERHPLVLVVLEAHDVALQRLRTHLGHVRPFDRHQRQMSKRLQLRVNIGGNHLPATLQ